MTTEDAIEAEMRGEIERLRAELERKGESIENRDDLLRDLRAENAELRGEVGTERLVHALQEQRLATSMSFQGAPRWDEDRVVIEHDWLDGHCGRCGEAIPQPAERDDLRAQLAAAQAQLADAVSKAIRRGDRAGLAEARLEAVRALGAEWISRGTISVYESAAELGELVLAALSAAPQPEPERSWTDLSGVEDDDATPASDEPARWGMASVPPKFRPSGPGPAASGTPDGGL